MTEHDGHCALCRRVAASEHPFDEAHDLKTKAITLALGVGLTAAIAALVHVSYGSHAAPATPAGAGAASSANAAPVTLAPLSKGASRAAEPARAAVAPAAHAGASVRPVRAFEAARVTTPAELQHAPARVKVAMYTAPWCYVCDDARVYLQVRGVELAEHDIEADAAALSRLREASPLEVLPTFELGGQTLVGFDSAGLSRAIDGLSASQYADAVPQQSPRP